MPGRISRKISEGDLAAVPLPGGGYAVVLVARNGAGRGKGISVLVYVFSPRFENVPESGSVGHAFAKHAAGSLVINSIRIQTGEWPIIGQLQPFTREEWPVPEFGKVSLFKTGNAWVVRYEGNELTGARRQTPADVNEALKRSPDALYGPDAAAREIEHLLQGGSPWTGVHGMPEIGPSTGS